MGNDGIPKVIHYCWFGGKPLNDLAKKCIASWEKYLPDYEIKRWDESNFNIDDCQYVKEAYEQGKWAFVSDYARAYILYNEGGVYFDTDVEVIKDIREIIQNGPYLGVERFVNNLDLEGYVGLGVAAGLGMAVMPKDSIIGELLEHYHNISFLDDFNNLDGNTIVIKLSKILQKYGLEERNEIQRVGDYYIYPIEYFNPLNDVTGKLNITNNTYSIHWYSGSWLDDEHIKAKKNRYKYCPKYGDYIGKIMAGVITTYEKGGCSLVINKIKQKIIRSLCC